MTNRHAGYVVVLEANIREDDAERTIAAISMLKSVISVTPVAGDVGQAIADSRAWHELRSRVVQFVLDQKPKS